MTRVRPEAKSLDHISHCIACLDRSSVRGFDSSYVLVSKIILLPTTVDSSNLRPAGNTTLPVITAVW